MLLRFIRWEGEDIIIEMFDIDGSRVAITLNAPDALDLAVWLTQEREKILEIMRITQKRMAAERSEEASHE